VFSNLRRDSEKFAQSKHNECAEANVSVWRPIILRGEAQESWHKECIDGPSKITNLRREVQVSVGDHLIKAIKIRRESTEYFQSGSSDIIKIL
jgi:hypothetical protein